MPDYLLDTGSLVRHLRNRRDATQLLSEFERLCLLPSDSVYQQWCENMVTLGEKVTVKTSTETLEGMAEAAERDGSLLLRKADGRIERIVAGDVTLRLA